VVRIRTHLPSSHNTAKLIGRFTNPGCVMRADWGGIGRCSMGKSKAL